MRGGTWKDTGNTVLGMDATVLDASTDPGSYWRIAHVIAILVPLYADGSSTMSHLFGGKGVVASQTTGRYTHSRPRTGRWFGYTHSL